MRPSQTRVLCKRGDNDNGKVVVNLFLVIYIQYEFHINLGHQGICKTVEFLKCR